MKKFEHIAIYTLYALYFLALVMLAFFIVYNAAFIGGDDAMFIKTTAIGKFFSDFDFIRMNRFYPLGHMDVNLAILLGSSATAHFAINAVVWVIFSMAVLGLCYYCIPSNTKRTIWVHIAVLATAVCITSRLGSIFLSLVYPEKMLCTMLAIFMLCTVRFFQTDKWGYGITALLAAIYGTYCKEPVFGALLVFSAVMLIGGYKTFTQKQRNFLYMLIINSIVYISVYLLLIYDSSRTSYEMTNVHGSIIGLAISMLMAQKMLLLAIPIVLFRIYALVLKRDTQHIFFDAILLAGWAYFCAMLLFNGWTGHYYMPCVVMLMPATLYFCLYYIKPLVTIILIGIFTGFYGLKIIGNVQANQRARTTIPTHVEQLAQYHSKGYALIWYDSAAEFDQLALDMMCLEEGFYKTYLNYLLQDEFNYTECSLDSCMTPAIVLYSKRNLTGTSIELDSLINTFHLQPITENDQVYMLEFTPAP